MRLANVDCMEATRVSWTDDRLDDLGGKVEGVELRLGKLEVRVEALDQRVGRLEHAVDELRLETQAGFRELRGEVKTLTTAMIGGFVAMFAALLGLMAAILTQL
jgi:hypothetical protein